MYKELEFHKYQTWESQSCDGNDSDDGGSSSHDDDDLPLVYETFHSSSFGWKSICPRIMIQT